MNKKEHLTPMGCVRLKESVIILVPADSSLPLQELVVFTQLETHLAEFFQPHFRLKESVETVDKVLIQQQANQVRETGCTSGMCPHVSPATCVA